ncbi:MAG TPA: hypothetical protein VKX49_29250 [Bryobacteraceae bacterium]|nr:hypothetical protein [Bryobacteraceae bacterium]
MWLRLTLVLACAAMFAQIPYPPGQREPSDRDLAPPAEEPRLPNGKLQRDEILKAEYEKNLDDARELSRLADDLKLQLEKNDRNVLSIATLKKTEEIEKIAKRIHDRLKH